MLKLKKQLDDAAARELYAHNLYKSLANQMQGAGYFGAQKFFISEGNEELEHYQKIADYVNDRGEVLSVLGVPPQNDKVSSLFDAFTIVHETESDLLDFYVKLYETAEDGDCVTAQFLLQFIEIQRKAVGDAKDKLATLKLAGDNSAALLIFDNGL